MDDESATAHYYAEAVGNTATPFDTGVELEIPKNPLPLMASSPEASEKWELTLREALEIALKNSGIVRQLRNGVGTATATAFDPAVAETRVLEELARFDASLTTNLFWGRDERQLNNNVSSGGLVANAGGFFEDATFGGGRGSGFQGTGDLINLQKPLATGGEVTVGFGTEFTAPNLGTRLFNSAWESRAFATIQQPLLNGAGVDLNRGPIVIARLRSDQALWDWKRDIGQLVRDVEQKYWELYAAQWQYWAASRAVEGNLEIVQRLQRLLDEGRGNASDLYEAEVQLHQLRRQRKLALAGDVITGSRVAGVLVVERELRSLMGLPPSDGRRIIAADEPIVAPIALNWESSVGEAFTFHPDIQRLKLAVAEQRMALMGARNGLKPRVDVFARYELNGLGDSFSGSIDQITDKTFPSWTVGVQGRVNLGYRREAALVQRAELQLNQVRELLRDKAREVEHSVAQAVMQVDVRLEAYDASTAARVAATRQLETQKMLHEEGRIPLDRLLSAIRNYTDTIVAETQDKVDYQIALANLEAAKGTIMRYSSIHVHEGRWDAAAYPQSLAQARDRARAIEWFHQAKPTMPAPDHLTVYDSPDPAQRLAPPYNSTSGDLPAPQPDSNRQDAHEIPLNLSGKNEDHAPSP